VLTTPGLSNSLGHRIGRITFTLEALFTLHISLCLSSEFVYELRQFDQIGVAEQRPPRRQSRRMDRWPPASVQLARIACNRPSHCRIDWSSPVLVIVHKLKTRARIADGRDGLREMFSSHRHHRVLLTTFSKGKSSAASDTPKTRRSRETLRELGGRASLSGSLGKELGGHAHSRHHETASGRYVRRRKPTLLPLPVEPFAITVRRTGGASGWLCGSRSRVLRSTARLDRTWGSKFNG